jgi:hypothetical protein
MVRWEPRPDDVRRFTEGDCHIFALALHKLRGWPTCAFRDWDGEPHLHAFVRHPDGDLIDIDGKRPPEAFFVDWDGESDYRAFDFREYQWTTPCFGYYSRRRATVVAKRLLAHYGL